MFPEIKSKLTQLAGRNPTALLTGMGVTGVVTTAYLTGRASFKAARLIDQENRNYVKEQERQDLAIDGSGLTNKDKLQLVWPLYLPPIAVGASTITSIVMANHTASKKIAALTVASGISERAFQEYKAKVIEKLGETKETAIRDEVAEDRIRNNPPPSNEVIIIDDGNVMCYDMQTGRYFKSSMEKLRQAENQTNFEILNHDYASLSFFYDEIGLPPTSYTEEVGWNSSNRCELSISTHMSPDDRPCIAIDFANPPFLGYHRSWGVG